MYSNYNAAKLIAHLQELPCKLLPAVDRYYVVRWLLNEESDSRYRSRTLGIVAQGHCLICSQDARLHPFATSTSPLCRDCLQKELRDSPCRPIWVQFCPQELLTEENSSLATHDSSESAITFLKELTHFGSNTTPEVVPCEYCHFGEASLEHWLMACPVVGAAISAAMGSIWHITCLTSPSTDKYTLCRLLRILAAIRRDLLTTGMLSPFAPTIPCNELLGLVHGTHHPLTVARMHKHFKRISQSLHLIDVPWASTRIHSQGQCPNLRNFLLELPQPALLGSTPMKNAYKTLPVPRLRAECLPNQTIAIVEEDSPLISLLQLTPNAEAAPCKVSFVPLPCACGEIHTKIIADTHGCPQQLVFATTANQAQGTNEQSSSCAAPSTDSLRYLLVQSDGSFLRTKGSNMNAGGSGFVLWDCHPGRLPVALLYVSIPEHIATDSMHAEALAFHAAVNRLLLTHGEWRLANPLRQVSIVLQMDNLPRVNYFNFQAKCSHASAAALMLKARTAISSSFGNVTVEYIPRESNAFADAAAGIASASIKEQHFSSLQQRQTGNPDQQDEAVGTLDLPLPQFRSATSEDGAWVDSAFSETNAITLQECPDLTANLAHKILPWMTENMPTKAASLKLYVSLITPNNDGSTCLKVTYTRRRGQRYYTSCPSAQRLSRLSRLLLFGSNHVELDLIGAHFSLFLYAATGSMLHNGRTVAQLRAEVASAVANTNSRSPPQDVVKKAFNIFLNTNTDKALAYIRSFYLFIPQELCSLFRTLDTQRNRVIAFAASKGFQPQDFETHNMMYFALEHLEQLFMRHFTQQLFQMTRVRSCVYVFDGLLLSPPPCAMHISLAAALACQALEIPNLQVQAVDLQQDRLAALEQICPGGSFSSRTHLIRTPTRKRKAPTTFVASFKKTKKAQEHAHTFHTTCTQSTLTRFFVKKNWQLF